MLTEIYCDKFADEKGPRPPIKLGRGLNIVVGGNDATNSIGKTTFLLAVDFALGGSTYAKKTSSVLKAIGHHSLFISPIHSKMKNVISSGTQPLQIRSGNAIATAFRSSLWNFPTSTNGWRRNTGLANLAQRFATFKARSFAHTEWAMMMFSGL